jgi:hypothetical protein
MPTDARVAPNVKQVVPFFNVTDIEASLVLIQALTFAAAMDVRYHSRFCGKIRPPFLRESGSHR